MDMQEMNVLCNVIPCDESGHIVKGVLLAWPGEIENIPDGWIKRNDIPLVVLYFRHDLVWIEKV